MNVGAGCSRTDHGHGSGDGLYEHYQGYYRLLSRIGTEYPHVVLENCSSGGLRIDLGIAKHTHMAFLSDPDMPIHSLQLFWGVTMMLAPLACLHFLWSQTRGAFPSLDLTKCDAETGKLDYCMRVGMLHAFGCSHPLPDQPESVKKRMAESFLFYKEKVRPYLRQADLYHLTGQPRRDGTGDSWCSFQFLMPSRTQALVFVFRLPGSGAEYLVRFKDLLSDVSYDVSWEQEGNVMERRTGHHLMHAGVVVRGLEEERSVILYLSESS